MRVLALLAAAALPACATVDYCDMTPDARCAWEQRLEDRANSGLSDIGSNARIDIVMLSFSVSIFGMDATV